EGRRGARDARGGLRAAVVPGGGAHRPWRTPARREAGGRGITGPRTVLAALADVGPALRGGEGAAALRGSAGRRWRRGHGASRPACREVHLRAARRDNRGAARARAPRRRP